MELILYLRQRPIHKALGDLHLGRDPWFEKRCLSLLAVKECLVKVWKLQCRFYSN